MRSGEQWESTVDYDAQSRPFEVTYPDDGSGVRFSVRNHYDSRGNLWAVDGMRLGHDVVLPGYQRLWEIEETHVSGQTRLESLGNHSETWTDIDPATGAVTAIETTSPAQPLAVQALSYEYDPRGNLLSRSDALQGIQGVGGGVSEWFDYDPIGRLICTRFGSGALPPQGPCDLGVAYLPNGNIDSKSDVGNYTYGDPAHPHAVTLTSGLPNQGEEYHYDAVGNQDRRGLITIGYTARNKPSYYDLTGGNIVRFEYAPGGERLRKLSGSTETIWFGNMYERRTDVQSGAVEHRYHVFSRDRTVVDIVRTASLAGKPLEESAEYQHVDHLGSLDVVTDDDGVVQQRVSFDAFGRRRDPDWLNASSPSFGPLASLGFTGQEEDHEIGVVDMHARLYDPRLGRFLNVDPHVTNPLNAQSWNGYSYVRNRPTVLIDPTGMDDVTTSGPFGVLSTGDAYYDEIIAEALHGAGAVIDMIASAGDIFQADGSLPICDTEDPPPPELTEGSFVDDGHHTALDAQWRGVVAPTMLASYVVVPTAVAAAPLLLTAGAYVAATPAGEFLGAVAGGYGLAMGIDEGDATKIALNGLGLALGAAGIMAEGEAAVTMEGLMTRGFCFVAGTPVVTPDGQRPIETIRVGERVRTLGDDACAGSMPAADLRRIEIQMVNPDNPEDLVQITTLRPVEWIVRNGAREGNLLYFALDEIGYRGCGRVTSISQDVEVRDGPGCVVLSTFTHIDATVRVLGFRGPAEPVGATSRHKFYSLDRRGWVPAATLRPGERVKTLDGQSDIEVNASLSGKHRVYNLEVATTHTYLVGSEGIWVHNSCAAPAASIAAADDVLVFRGTGIGTELQVYRETGHLLSDAARAAYLEGASLPEAYSSAANTHAGWVRIWGSEGTFAEAHGAFGTELSQAFGLPRTLLSVTTDPAVAARFAGPAGEVFSAMVPRSSLIQQTLQGAGESEFLLRFGGAGFL